MIKELGITTKQALSTMSNHNNLSVTETPFGLNIHDHKSKKTLSVNLAKNDKGTYSKDKHKFYYQKAGKNKHGRSWNVIQVPKQRVANYSSIKDFLKWYFK